MVAILKTVDVAARVLQLVERAEYLGDISVVSERLAFVQRGLHNAGLAGTELDRTVAGLQGRSLALSQAAEQVRRLPAQPPVARRHFLAVTSAPRRLSREDRRRLDSRGVDVDRERDILQGSLATRLPLAGEGAHVTIDLGPPASFQYRPDPHHLSLLELRDEQLVERAQDWLRSLVEADGREIPEDLLVYT